MAPEAADKLKETTPEQEQIKRELVYYQQASTIYDQIFSLHKFLIKIADVFLITVGAVWAVVASNQLNLPLWARVFLCGLVAIGGLQICFVNCGALRSIRGRFELVDKLGEAAFPTILAKGRESFSTRMRWLSWGKDRSNFFWYLIPLSGLIGSVVLASLILINNDKGGRPVTEVKGETNAASPPSRSR